MKLLLDTHTALWLFNEHENLSKKVKDLLRDEVNTITISIVSAWEIAVKTSLGKMGDFRGGVKTFLSYVDRHSIELLALMPSHIEMVETLPFIHRDPFDRLLIAAAIAEQMIIVSADEYIHKYNVQWIW